MSSDCAGSNLALCAKPPRMVASDSSRRTCARERRWEITLSAVFRKRKCPPRDVTEAAHDLASRERVTTAIDARDRTPSAAYSMHWRFEMKAIVVKDPAAGTAGMTLVDRPEPEAEINDVVVRVHASVFTSGELTWPSTWTDRLGRDRTPVIPGQELAGVVTALGYGRSEEQTSELQSLLRISYAVFCL